MKIGIITFHWGTNYGAVLQAFALQQYLERCGYEVEIINYVPFKVKALQMLSLIKNHKPAELLKEYRLNKSECQRIFEPRDHEYLSHFDHQ